MEALYEETKITIDDTVSTAYDKGVTRKKAFRLAILMYNLKPDLSSHEVSSKWSQVFNDSDEFSKVRTILDVESEKDGETS